MYVTSRVCVSIKFDAITTKGISAALVETATASVISCDVLVLKTTHVSNSSVVCTVKSLIAVSILITLVL
jgi:hypothetical protein